MDLMSRHGKHRDPRRTFSYPEDEWQAVQKIAAERGESVTEVIRRALRDYVTTDNSAA